MITPVQFGYTRLVTANGGHLVIGLNHFVEGYPLDDGSTGHVCSMLLPYTVPSDKWLLLTDLHLASKQLGQRNSYFLLHNIISVDSSSPTWSPKLPYIIVPEWTINGEFINNSNEDQYMVAIVQGFLLDVIPEEDWHMALARGIRELNA